MKKFIVFIILLIALLVTIGVLFYFEIVPQLKATPKTNVDLSDIYFIKDDINNNESNDDEYEILGDSDFSGDYDLIYEEEFSGDEVIFEAEPAPTTVSTTATTTKATTTKTTTSNSSSTPATSKPVVSSSFYYIKVNRTQNTVTNYQKDDEGNYTIPAKAMVCSIGTSTPKAGSKYKITSYRRAWNGLKGNVYGQYAVQIVGNILFHSVPYTSKSNDSLEYWEYDKLGTQASLGCIRLTVKDAKWIYDNIPAGTYVEFYEDDNPGPLGKPVAQKISDNELCRNWDPTDYVEGNPWHDGTSIEAIEPTAIPEIIPSGNTASSGNDIIINTEPTPDPTTSIDIETTPEPTPTENVIEENVEIVPIEELTKSTPRPTSVRKYNKSTPAPTHTPVPTPIEETPEPTVDETTPSSENNEEPSNEAIPEETNVNEPTTTEPAATEETSTTETITTEETSTTETAETAPATEAPSPEQSSEPEFKLSDTPVWSIE